MNSEILENIYHTEKYQTYRMQYSLNNPDFTRIKQTPERLDLGDGYYGLRNSYECQNISYHWSNSQTVIFDKGDKEVYRYENINSEAEFLTLIHHKNQHDYLLFRVDLYGYGVFDLVDNSEFIFVPEGETFILTDPRYNPINNILAVGGCYWACPGSVILLDFTQPLVPHPYKDVMDYINGGYDSYDGIKSFFWQGTDLIAVPYELTDIPKKQTNEKGELCIIEDEYLSWLSSKP
ncbi:MAG: hypothetical protein LBR25_05670 [Erysipelotrichaceae bacterium]|jgi:hypothetical protein|nr:hypothetical protein [Erysipelotrichaceae bacterium]